MSASDSSVFVLWRAPNVTAIEARFMLFLTPIRWLIIYSVMLQFAQFAFNQHLDAMYWNLLGGIEISYTLIGGTILFIYSEGHDLTEATLVIFGLCFGQGIAALVYAANNFSSNDWFDYVVWFVAIYTMIHHKWSIIKTARGAVWKRRDMPSWCKDCNMCDNTRKWCNMKRNRSGDGVVEGAVAGKLST